MLATGVLLSISRVADVWVLRADALRGDRRRRHVRHRRNPAEPRLPGHGIGPAAERGGGTPRTARRESLRRPRGAPRPGRPRRRLLPRRLAPERPGAGRAPARYPARSACPE